MKVFSYKAYQFPVVCITWNSLNSYWVGTAQVTQVDLKLWGDPSHPLVSCSCPSTSASSAHVMQSQGRERNVMIWQKSFFCTVCFQSGVEAFSLLTVRRQWGHIAVSGEKSTHLWCQHGLREASAACGMFPGCLYYQLEHLIKPPFRFIQNKIVEAMQTLFIMLQPLSQTLICCNDKYISNIKKVLLSINELGRTPSFWEVRE